MTYNGVFREETGSGGAGLVLRSRPGLFFGTRLRGTITEHDYGARLRGTVTEHEGGWWRRGSSRVVVLRSSSRGCFFRSTITEHDVNGGSGVRLA